MRKTIVTMIALGGLAVPALAQTAGSPAASGTATGAVPGQIGNRANGFSYQPSQGDVGSREHSAGVAPSQQQQNAADDELFKLDKKSLQKEGESTSSVPTPAH